MRTPAPAHRIPVALIDDHALLRNMLASMIGAMPAYEVVLEAANGAEFVQAMKATGVRVAVAVVDLHMPVMDGYETIAWLRTHQPGTRALALTFERTPEALRRSLDAGACGFVLKDASYADFKEALDQVATVGHYQSTVEFDLPAAAEPRVQEADHDLGTVHQDKPAVAAAPNSPPGLNTITERERLFIKLACDKRELTYDQIGEEMEVHRRTVDGFRDAVFAKLNVKTRAGMVFAAVQWGLVTD